MEFDIYPDFIHICGARLEESGIATNYLGDAWIVYLCDMTKGGCGKYVNGPSIDSGPEEYWDWAKNNLQIKIIGEVRVNAD